jgi:hypothetical protein
VRAGIDNPTLAERDVLLSRRDVFEAAMRRRLHNYQLGSFHERWLPLLLCLLAGGLATLAWIFVGIEYPAGSAVSCGILHLHWFDGPATDPSYFVKDLRWRLTWEVSFVALTVLAFIAVLASFRVARTSLAGDEWRHWQICGVVGAILIATVFWLFDKGLLFPETIKRLDISGFQLATAFMDHLGYKAGQADRFKAVIEAGMTFLVFPPLALAMGASAVLHMPFCDVGDGARKLPERLESLNLILYLGAALLVAGTLEIWAFYSWGEAYLPSQENQVYLVAGRNISAAAGIFFSFLLALIYLPSAYLLRQSVKAPVGAVPGGTIESWGAIMGRVIAILAPLIAGAPFSKILGS